LEVEIGVELGRSARARDDSESFALDDNAGDFSAEGLDVVDDTVADSEGKSSKSVTEFDDESLSIKSHLIYCC
jgi:hypothetical protein